MSWYVLLFGSCESVTINAMIFLIFGNSLDYSMTCSYFLENSLLLDFRKLIRTFPLAQTFLKEFFYNQSGVGPILSAPLTHLFLVVMKVCAPFYRVFLNGMD